MTLQPSQGRANQPLDARYGSGAILVLSTLWCVLAVCSWRNVFPWTEAAFYAALAAGIAAYGDLIPAAVVLALFAPMAFRVPRPYAAAFVAVALTGFLFGRLRAKAVPGVTGAVIVATLYVGLSCISALAFPSERALPYVIANAESLAVVVILAVTLDSLDAVVRLMKAIAIAAALSLLIGGLHYFWRDSMWATQQYLATGATIGLGGVEKYSLNYGQIVLGGRIFWAGLEPNYWSAQLHFPLWLAVGLAGAAVRPRWKAAWTGVAALVLVALIGTYSRAAAITEAAMVGAFAATRGRRGILTLVVMTAAGATVGMYLPLLVERLSGIPESLEFAGGGGRFELWREALQRWLASPLWGHGIGTYEYGQYGTAHNTYLNILAELGLVGLLPYVAFIGMGTRAWYETMRCARAIGDWRMVRVAEGGLLGTVATLLNACTISAQDARLIWIPVVLGVALRANVRRVAGWDGTTRRGFSQQGGQAGTRLYDPPTLPGGRAPAVVRGHCTDRGRNR